MYMHIFWNKINWLIQYGFYIQQNGWSDNILYTIIVCFGCHFCICILSEVGGGGGWVGEDQTADIGIDWLMILLQLWHIHIPICIMYIYLFMILYFRPIHPGVFILHMGVITWWVHLVIWTKHWGILCAVFYLPRRRRPGTRDIANPPPPPPVCLSESPSVTFSFHTVTQHVKSASMYFLETLQVHAPCHGVVLYSFWYWWNVVWILYEFFIYWKKIIDLFFSIFHVFFVFHAISNIKKKNWCKYFVC